MAKPLNTVIFDEIEARLGNIKTANEYSIELKKIERASLTPFKGYDLPACNFWASNVVNASDVYGMDTRSIPLIIEAHTLTRDLPFIDVCDDLASNIIVGLNRATLAPKVSDDKSLDLGDLVEEFLFEGYDYQIGKGQAPWCAILSRFTIVFKTDIGKMS